ncbi:MAG: FapA family protein [Acidaminobacteraceae bacterium]
MIDQKLENNAEVPYEIAIKIASDYYSAFMSFNKYVKDIVITKEAVLEAIKAKNISYGIDLDVIDYAVQNQSKVSDLLIAKGIKHENGSPGEVIFKVKKENKIKPKMLENGNVDFKELNLIQTTVAGQVLAEMKLPTDGISGTTVTNRTIGAKNGKAVVFKFGKNVVLSDDGLALIADANGTILFEDEKISIIELLEIKGDVGVKTGNIKFSGKVIVNGNVTTGYSVECDDDLTITGIVEGATIICNGTVTIGAGIQGNDNADLTVAGDLISNFINNCKCVVKGNIETGTIMHSNVVCDSSIHIKGKRGLLVGGEVNARKEIVAKIIGSEMGTITKMRLGVDSKLIEKYQSITDELKEAKEGKNKVEQLSNLLTRQLAADPSNQANKEMLEKTLKSKEQYNLEFRELTEQFMEINKFINELQDAKVTAALIFVGTRLRIGNSHYNVKHALKSVELKKDSGQIVAVSI